MQEFFLTITYIHTCARTPRAIHCCSTLHNDSAAPSICILSPYVKNPCGIILILRKNISLCSEIQNWQLLFLHLLLCRLLQPLKGDETLKYSRTPTFFTAFSPKCVFGYDLWLWSLLRKYSCLSLIVKIFLTMKPTRSKPFVQLERRRGREMKPISLMFLFMITVEIKPSLVF